MRRNCYLRASMKNYLGQSLALSALVLLFLLVLTAVSNQLPLEEYGLRKMDILADIRIPEQLDTLTADTLLIPNLDTSLQSLSQDTLRHLVDSAFFGKIIEDYSFNFQGLRPFFQAVDSIKSHQKTVRVAFFGDSFIEGDIFLGDLRDTLQGVWGGAGVGFVPISSEIARFRRSFIEAAKGWNSFSILKNEGNPLPLGINGHVYLPTPDASISYQGTQQYAFRRTAQWNHVRLFYQTDENKRFLWQSNSGDFLEATLLGKKGQLKIWELNSSPMYRFYAQFPDSEGLALYGASLESGPGVYFDNFSVRGNSGGKLCLIPEYQIKAFDQYQQYDLVILQYGLNAVTNSLRNLKWYEAELEKTYQHVRASFPNTPILIISVPDRGGKVDGELKTMVSVPYIVQMQRNLAWKHGFLFYDCFKGMGGAGTMVRLAASTHPSLVSKDYTHLSHEGGRMLGLQLADLFLSEKEKIKSTYQ
jgi:hypothetical protein